MLLFKADKDGIVFHTGSFKALHKQLQSNPNVEFCFNDFNINIQIRIKGLAKLDTDQTLIEEIINHPSREFLKQWIETEGPGILAVYRITDLQYTTWTMDTNFNPTHFAKLK